MKKIKQKKNTGTKFRKPTIFGILFAILILALLFWKLGSEGIKKNSLLIILLSALIILILTIVMMFFSRTFSEKIEPEDNEKILELKMNQGLAYSTLLTGLSIAFIIPGITILPFTNIVGLILITGLFFLFIGVILFNFEYMPRLTKLLIKYEIEDMNKR